MSRVPLPNSMRCVVRWATPSSPWSPTPPTRPRRASSSIKLRPAHAGAVRRVRPQMSPLQDQNWETFSANWNVDVAQAFHWTRHALQRPLAPGSSVILMSSGAAVNGSPLSGGYAGRQGDRQVHRQLRRRGVGPGRPRDHLRARAAAAHGGHRPGGGGAAYAERQGVDVDTFARRPDPHLLPSRSARRCWRSPVAIPGSTVPNYSPRRVCLG